MLRLMGSAAALALLPARRAHAQSVTGQHGLSFFGDLKYPKGFAHFDYVNPAAPKGGTLSQIGPTAAYNAGFESFDTLNGYILKGNAAQRLDLLFDTLMRRAYDEPDALYGMVAETIDISPDGNTLTFHLREAARFHDGTRLTAEDAAFSFQLLKDKGHPLIASNLLEVESFKAADPQTLVITLTGRQTRDLPLFIAGSLPVFSKAFYSSHDFADTLDKPLGSGPYRVASVDPGRQITYERVADYWARDLNVNIGQWNFDQLQFEYFRDRTVGFEAFAARQYLLREEFTSKVWATQYDFPAVKEGKVRLLTLPDATPSGAQGWFINTRRDKFKDVRVREAIGLAFDFEWTNRNMFHDLYLRTSSYFENSPMKASGTPDAAELALLEPFRDQLPESVFGPAYTAPVSDGSGKDRRLLRQAAGLLDEAGWRVVDGQRRNNAGEALTIEILGTDALWERIAGNYVQNLKLLGIETSLRTVDSAQYQDRLKNFDFDLAVQRFSMGLTPGIETRGYLTSKYANLSGSNNLPGIADPVVDALVETIIAAADRPSQETACKALDRVLRAGHYWVPHWYKASHTLAFWDIYAFPETQARYDRAIESTWWVDPAKAERLGIKE
ncbi:MAG: ABC transporter substrate-binding protein [Rhizobiales bacterium]|nr:ABC transporter substrate-binding protein [Hyphomicrobiales bacterium]